MDSYLDGGHRALTVTPGGSQTRSKGAHAFPGAYPRAIARGSGAYVWTEDGRQLTDWICALGAISLGHAYPDVVEAVSRQLVDGTIFSLPHHLETSVAERLLSIVPCGNDGMVRWMKTGSEADAAAARVARIATGRNVIAVCGYLGYFDWTMAARPEHPGVPAIMERLVRPFRYNDLATLERIFYDTGDDIAAVMMEATLVEPPMPGFLDGVRTLAHRHGALFILDEVVTGGRWASGGAQEYFGITPDLATFGKAIGGGLPISALVGRRELMRHAIVISGTFGGDCIGLAAADATLARYQQGGVCEHMWRIGTHLMDGYNALAEKVGAPTRMIGQPPHPVIQWDEEQERDPLATDGVGPPNRYRASLFFQETVKRGILLGPDGNNVMLSHTYDDVERTLAACSEAMDIVRDAIAAGTVRERIEGNPIDPAPAWRVTQ